MIHYFSLAQSPPLPLEPTSPELAEAAVPAPLWINLTAPTPGECEAVSKRYSIPLPHLQAALDFNERPRVEYDSDTLLIVARTPLLEDRPRRSPFNTCPVAIVVTAGLVVSICLKSGIIDDLVRLNIRGEGSHIAGRLALTILLRISTSFIDFLKQIDEQVQKIESTLERSMQNQELVSMLKIENSLIYFLTALKGNQSVMEKIRSTSLLIASAQEQSLLDDVLIENKQATDLAQIYTEIMGSLGDAFAAIVSNNLNKVMKVLTGLTIVCMIPSIIGALYGMNVALPWQENPLAFTALCALCLGLSAAVFFILRKINWM